MHACICGRCASARIFGQETHEEKLGEDGEHFVFEWYFAGISGRKLR